MIQSLEQCTARLEELDRSLNDLNGTMPEEVCTPRTPNHTLLFLSENSDEVQCNCCAECRTDNRQGCTEI